jgi:NAD(P)-dependent dehydrogenase (short-subunit alcohol dehydrogenase family)
MSAETAHNDTRVALITGASRGFGLAMARSLAADRWSLVIDARQPGPLDEARHELGQITETRAIPGDVTDPVHREELIAAAHDLGGLDLLINNASVLGPSPQPPLAHYPLDVYRRVIEVNVVAPLALIQASLPMLRRRHGTIVNITSDASWEAYPDWGGYGSSKAALNQLSRILDAEEEAIKVIWFDPGDMNTRMHQEAFPGEDISDRPPPEQSVPALVTLMSRGESGFHRAADVLETS